MAIDEGARRTSIGGPAVPVATEIGVTQPLPRLKLALATYRVLPSGVTAMATGSGMTLIGRPAVPVTVETGRTQSDMSSATYRVRPSGVLMIELDSPTSIGRPTAPVRTEIGVTAPPAGLVSRFAEVTYRVGGIATAGAGACRDAVRSTGTATPAAAITAAQVTAPSTRRRLRSRTPAATDLDTIGPAAGSPATARAPVGSVAGASSTAICSSPVGGPAAVSGSRPLSTSRPRRRHDANILASVVTVRSSAVCQSPQSRNAACRSRGAAPAANSVKSSIAAIRPPPARPPALVQMRHPPARLPAPPAPRRRAPCPPGYVLWCPGATRAATARPPESGAPRARAERGKETRP